MKNLKSTLCPQIVFITMFLFYLPGFAQDKQSSYQLQFKNVIITPLENREEFFRNLIFQEEQVFNGKIYKIVQLYNIPDSKIRKDLLEAGITLLDYIPENGYFASIRQTFNVRSEAINSIRAITDITEEIKLSPALFNADYPGHALRPENSIELMVSYFPDIEQNLVLETAVNSGLQVSHHNTIANYFHVVIPISNINTLINLPFVVYAEPVYPEPQPENYTGRTLHRSNTMANDFPGGRHYDGTGVNVMLQDDGTIGPHIDYEGRVLAQYLGYNSGDHGDHCAGIIMAAGNLDPKGRGNAPGANLYVYSASDYPGFASIPSHYFTNQIRVTSTSYSDGCNAGYTTLARSLDQQIRLYPSLMHVFSAGNEGGSNCGYGAGPGWGNITGGHKAGKNVIAVANLDFADALSGSSSRGPAHDGRIKPDISAKGSDVYSTIDPNTYGLKSGTSMSCPGVAGTISQLYHAYRELYGGIDPPGGLIKGIVLNTADDLGNPGPDFKFGWGRINGLRAVEVLEDGLFDSTTISQGEGFYYEFFPPQNTSQLRIMVYWTDYEASVNTNQALVNNLDITLTDPQSQVFYPWVLNHYPHPDSLNKTAVRGSDNRNNMEQITLDFPQGGPFILRINGTVIPQGPQKCYLIYEYISDEIVITYPYGGESLVPGETEMIRWDAFGNEGTFNIEYSSDNGQTWGLVKDNLPGNLRYYAWTIPTAMSGNGLIRVSRDGKTAQNQVPFSIFSVPGNLSVDWACENDLHLSWSEVYGATSYTVYKLGEKYMEPVGTTTLNSFIVNNINALQTHWFSVSATGTDGAKGRRSVAIEKSPGVINCNTVDAMMVSVPSVDWGIFQTCMNVNNLNVTAEIKNFGLEAITNPEISYQLDGGAIFTETYDGEIMPDSTALYTFANTINVSQLGNYVLKTWITYPPDQNPSNNLIETTIGVIEGTVITPGSMQNIENFTPCVPVPICELSPCQLSEGWINLTNVVQDDIDWRTWSGTTPTYGTGPSFDHTTGTTVGKYLFLEASISCFYKEAVLVTPCIDLTGGGSPQLNLWYHAFGIHIGHLHVDVFDGNEIIYDVTQPVFGDQGDVWQELNVDLSPWNGKVIGLRIRGYTGGGERSDLAIDDINITELTGLENGQAYNRNYIRVYPNPASDLFHVLAHNTGTEEFELKITDLFGVICYERKVYPSSGTISETINFIGKSKGMYFIELTSDTRSYQSKIIVR